MNKIKYILLLVAMVCALISTAQIPGYLGRTLEIGHDFMVSPHFSEGRGFLNSPVNVKFNIYINHTYSRNRLVGFNYSYMQTSFNSGTFRHSTHLMSIRLLKFRRSDLPAPLGFYTGIEFGVGIPVATHVKGEITYYDFIGNKMSYERGRSVVTVRPLFDIVIGRKMGLGKHFMFNTSINAGVSGFIGGLVDFLGMENTGSVGIASLDKKYRRQAAYRFYAQHMVQLNLGFSYLIK